MLKRCVKVMSECNRDVWCTTVEQQSPSLHTVTKTLRDDLQQAQDPTRERQFSKLHLLWRRGAVAYVSPCTWKDKRTCHVEMVRQGQGQCNRNVLVYHCGTGNM